jgi:hypothetical protein
MTYEHHISRRLAVQSAQAWNFGLGKYFFLRYKTGINNTVTYLDGKKTDYFLDSEQHKGFLDVLDKSLSKHEFVISMIPEGTIFLDEMYNKIKGVIDSDIGIKEKYQIIIPLHNEFFSRKWMAFRITNRIVLKLESILKKRFHNKKVQDILRILSVPLAPNDVTNERIDLLNMKISGNKDFKCHIKKYCHIPLFDFDHDPYDEDHFKREYSEIKNPRYELEKIQSSFCQRKKEYEDLLKEIKPKPDLKNLFTMMKRAAVFRDFGDTIRQKLNLQMIRLYKEIGENIGLTHKEVAFLTNDEIMKSLDSKKCFSKEEINRRRDSFLLIQKASIYMIYSGVDAKEILGS